MFLFRLEVYSAMRVCPQCDYVGEAEVCPVDGFPTVNADVFPEDDDVPSLVGTVFGGRYAVERLVGRGGMGWVFRAQHTLMGQPVALKVLRRTLVRDRTILKRFFQEARTCSTLRHPNTIKVHDFGVSDDGYPFLIMEFLSGQTLEELLRREGALSAARAIAIGTQICKSLGEAHAQGIVHRDLKPGNVFLADIPGETDYVKVLDFGIAKFVEKSGDDSQQSLTGTGMMIGTPRYMSPEQIRAHPLDGRSDLYALGLILYEMLAGVPPFPADSSVEIIAMQLTQPAPSLGIFAKKGRLGGGLVELVGELLAKKPEERPSSTDAVIARLEAVAGEGGSTAPSQPSAATVPPELQATGMLRSRAEEAIDISLDPTELQDSARLPAPNETSSGSPAPTARRRRRAWFVAVALFAVLGAVAWLLLRPGDSATSGASGGPAPGTEPTAALTRGVGDGSVDAGPGAETALHVGEHDVAGAFGADVFDDGAGDGASDASGSDGSASDAVGDVLVEDGTIGRDSAPDIAMPIRMAIRSKPTGAEVLTGGRVVGRTPVVIEGRRGETVELTLRKKGYRSYSETVDIEEGVERSFKLERSKHRPLGPPRSGHPRSPKPSVGKRPEIPIFD